MQYIIPLYQILRMSLMVFTLLTYSRAKLLTRVLTTKANLVYMSIHYLQLRKSYSLQSTQ